LSPIVVAHLLARNLLPYTKLFSFPLQQYQQSVFAQSQTHSLPILNKHPAMFILTKLADLVQIAPKDFGKVSIIALQDAINTKYSNKLIPGIGLCICLQEVLWHSEGLIGHGDGLVNVNGKDRLIRVSYFVEANATIY
jgi:SHS2 domain found in N terminus of Rpb7p/Rpc25p/MJ0397